MRDDDEADDAPKAQNAPTPRNPPGAFFTLTHNDFRVEDQNGKTLLCTTQWFVYRC